MFYPTTCVRLRYGYIMDMLSGFSRESDYPLFQLCPKTVLYFPVSAPVADLPTTVNAYAVKRPFRRTAAVSHLRLHVAPLCSYGMLTVSAIAFAVRLRLRSRLTPG